MTPKTRTPEQASEGQIRVNGTELYYQVRGSGPALFMIHGTGADSGCYDRLASRLADAFTVLTYDRRGWSRSPRPEGWLKTSIEEQADDAAWLLKATGNAPALVFGSSSAGLTTLDLLLRHPDVLRGAVVHEPSTFTWLPMDFLEAQFAEMNALIGSAVARGGPRAGHQAFLTALAGEDGLDAVVDPTMLDRWLGNAAFMFEYEFPSMLLGYRPDPAAIAAVTTPVTVMRAAESMPINVAAAEWLAGQLNTKLHVASGAHLAYGSRPDEFAGTLRQALAVLQRTVSTIGTATSSQDR